jgi:hypothetical protein
MICKVKFVRLTNMRIRIVLKLFSRRVEGFKMEQRSVVNVCLKLKKTATELFEMSRSGYGKE